MMKILHFLLNRLTDGGKVVSPTRRSSRTPQMSSGTRFYYRLSEPRGYGAAERIKYIEEVTSSGFEPAIFQLAA
jgi:hypothetical protein